MRARRFQVGRAAIACAAVVALSAPVAVATPPEEEAAPPVTGVEIAPPPAEFEIAAPLAEAETALPPPPPAEAVPAPVEQPPVAPAPEPTPTATAEPADAERAHGEGPRDAAPPSADPAPVVASPAVSAPLRAAARAAQQPPPEEPVAPPAEQLPPQSDPSCVFPQYHPVLADEPCEVLAADCTVLGTPGPDILVGSATADLICGLGGDDEIDGGDGDDSILGGDGNDRITGGPGADCLLGQAGEDEFVDAGEADENAAVGVTDVAVEEYQEFPAAPGAPGFRIVAVGRDGVCHVIGVASQPVVPQPSNGLESVEAAGVVYELSQLINQASGEADAAFPLELPDTARAVDGVVRLLLDCDGTRVTGTLELFEQRGDRRVSAGEAEFDCTPPSEVAEVELEDAARERLEDRGRLAVIARVTAEGYSAAHEDRLTIRSAP